MLNGESFNSPEGERSGEDARATYSERGRKVIESISLSELAAIDIKSLSDQELEDLNNRLKADIEASYARLGITPAEAAPAPVPEVAPEEPADVPEEEPEDDEETPSGDATTVIPVTVGPKSVSPDEILGETPVEEPESTPEEASEELEEEDLETIDTSPETITPEEAEATYEKAKKKSGFKNFLKKTVLPMALAAAIAFGFGANTANKADAEPHDSYSPVKTEQSIDAEEVGIIDGYDKQGMWESDSKAGAYNFAYAPEVAEVCDNDECEMIKYAANNQVESFADYLANLPEELQPEGFKGLSILETEDKLESLSNEDYEAIQSQFNGVIDQGFTCDHVLNGKYHNAYMKLKDPNGDVTHENMDLVNCVTTEDNYKATEVYWTDDGTADGNVIGSMIIKIVRNDEGDTIDGCMQVVNPDDTIYVGMPTITPNHPGDPTPDDTGEETTGDEGTGEETTGSEDTGEETTGSEDTGEETTGDEGTGEETTGDEGTDINPKDPENLERIDDNIGDDIAEDVGTGEIDVTPTPTEEVESQTPSEQPSDSDYQGTEATTTQNDTSTHAEPVQEQTSSGNNYSNDNGGAHQSEPAPVKPKPEPTPPPAPEPEPQTTQEASDTLEDLGIE